MIGKTLQLDGQSFAVVGVMPRTFQLPGGRSRRRGVVAAHARHALAPDAATSHVSRDRPARAAGHVESGAGRHGRASRATWRANIPTQTRVGASSSCRHTNRSSATSVARCGCSLVRSCSCCSSPARTSRISFSPDPCVSRRTSRFARRSAPAAACWCAGRSSKVDCLCVQAASWDWALRGSASAHCDD